MSFLISPNALLHLHPAHKQLPSLPRQKDLYHRFLRLSPLSSPPLQPHHQIPCQRRLCSALSCNPVRRCLRHYLPSLPLPVSLSFFLLCFSLLPLFFVSLFYVIFYVLYHATLLFSFHLCTFPFLAQFCTQVTTFLSFSFDFESICAAFALIFHPSYLDSYPPSFLHYEPVY